MDISFVESDLKKSKGIDNIIKDAEQINLSGDDLLRLTDNKTKILKYEDLKTYDSLEQIFNPHGCFIMLYQTAENYGHWVTVIDRGNRHLEFYDSYGLKPDEELNMNNEYHLRIHGGEIVPHLSALIRKDNWKVLYNKKKLQKYLEDTNTCGRYCALRVRFIKESMDKFNILLIKNKHYDPDFWVSSMTLLC